MNDDSSNDAHNAGGDSRAQSAYETLEADVLEESKEKAKKRRKANEVGMSDAAVTAEFDYIDDWDDDSEASDAQDASTDDEDATDAKDAPPQAGLNPNAAKRKKKRAQKNGAADSDGGPITRALQDFDASLGQSDDDAAGAGGPELSRSEANLGSSGFDRPESSGAWGFDQPQVSGVFSRYDEETRESDSDEFDLFEDDGGDQPPERTLQDIVNAHEKQVRRLEKRLVYQKEVIQVVSELLVEARVISKRELKKRLRALRDKSS